METLSNSDQGYFYDKIKCVILTGKNVTNQTSPCKLVAAQPQGFNEVCDAYTYDILKIIADYNSYELLNIYSDGLLSDFHLFYKKNWVYSGKK